MGTTVASSDLVLAVLAYDGSPGAATFVAPATALGTHCTGDSALCMNGAYFFTAAASTPAVTTNLGASRNWVGLLGTIYADVLFADDFD